MPKKDNVKISKLKPMMSLEFGMRESPSEDGPVYKVFAKQIDTLRGRTGVATLVVPKTGDDSVDAQALALRVQGFAVNLMSQYAKDEISKGRSYIFLKEARSLD